MDNGLGVALPFPLPVTATLGVDDGDDVGVPLNINAPDGLTVAPIVRVRNH